MIAAIMDTFGAISMAIEVVLMIFLYNFEGLLNSGLQFTFQKFFPFLNLHFFYGIKINTEHLSNLYNNRVGFIEVIVMK